MDDKDVVLNAFVEVFMKNLFLISFCALFLSCAKLSYIVDQGVGQVSLEVKARDNDEVLRDKNIDQKHKEKIKKIMAYKDFFYSYFKKEPTNIYSQTTFLDRPAVTYLVVASPPEKIEAVRHSFPIVGEFPYIGFFDQSDAKKFAKKLLEEGYEVYTRPVYAYSTLNQWIFDDNILSSFFAYDEVELAEMIFHELFHTIFFIKNEVALNENLAQFFSRELMFEYFNYTNEQRTQYILRKHKEKLLTQKIVSLAKDLQQAYTEKGRTLSSTKNVRKTFLENVFRPQIQDTCNELNLDDCWPLKKEWNNARFAGFLTYEAGQNKIEKFKSKYFTDLKSFFVYLVKSKNKLKNKEGLFEESPFKEI
ncbi:MAG: aminopeptidase [Bacteriovoracaceae bacterium]|nr:aminopeptidase [Bacteriovoracaceae bacterium]